MSIDFAAQLNAVSRSVTALQRDGHPARKVTLERTYDTSAEDLRDAITRPERLRRWFLPVTGDLQPGGQYQLEGNADGQITQCDPPHYLAVTWEFGGGKSWVEVQLTAETDTRARLTLSHTCPLDEHWDTYGPGAAGVGWDLGLLGLALYLAGVMGDNFDEAAFAASDDGKAFMTGSSKDWERAAVASGDDPGDAKTAASNTTAFYTGDA